MCLTVQIYSVKQNLGEIIDLCSALLSVQINLEILADSKSRKYYILQLSLAVPYLERHYLIHSSLWQSFRI